jgi:hypothetical protein
MPGESEIRCPVYGQPYTSERRVERYGSTRRRAITAYEEATGFKVEA